MRVTRALMGMPVAIELVGGTESDREALFSLFAAVDARFSTYKHDSEISQLNRGDVSLERASKEMLEVLSLCEHEKTHSGGVFDIRTPDGTLDPSGLVKGWALRKAAQLAEHLGYSDYWIEAGGDIQTSGRDEDGNRWRVGIRNPFEKDSLACVICPDARGVATSGTYLRGTHIYDPRTGLAVDSPYVSLTVVGPDVYEADMWATKAFVLGEDGLALLARMNGFEAYAIGHDHTVTTTPDWNSLVSA